MAENRNLFRLTRFFLLKLPPLFRFFAKFRKPQKRLLIIKTDAIGDYVLFRNFIEVVKRSEQYQFYQIDLLGNRIWADLALKYDSTFIERFFFVKPDNLYHSPLKTLRMGWRLFKNNYDLVLQPTFARTFIGDGLAGFTAAKHIIGFHSDTERISPKYKVKTDKFYTGLLTLPFDIYFEFERSRYFFEAVLKQAINLNGPQIPVNAQDRAGIVIFAGAGVLKRGWEADKFLSLIKKLMEQTSQTIYLAGGPAEISTGKYLEENLPANRIANRIDQTTLVQLVELIGSVSLVISNETSAAHIAAATGTNVVCILGGGHFDRFAPYPEDMVNRPVCVYEKMDCYHCNWSCKFKTEPNDPYPCIGNIAVDAVWQAVKPFIVEV